MRKLAKLPAASVDCLLETVCTLWAEVDSEYFKKLSDSKPKRMKAVLEVKDVMRKYYWLHKTA